MGRHIRLIKGSVSNGMPGISVQAPLGINGTLMSQILSG